MPHTQQRGGTDVTKGPAPQGSRWLRTFLPILIVVAWFVAAGVGGPYFGRVDEVSSNDQTSYLPATAESTQVQKRLTEFTASAAIPAVVVVTRSDGAVLDADLLDRAGKALESAVGQIPGKATSSPLVASKDASAAEAFLQVPQDDDVGAAVDALRSQLRSDLPGELTVHVTGPAGFTADLLEAFSGIDGILLVAALAAVFVILVLVYRSVLLPVLVLLTSLFALCVALLSVWWLAKAGILLLTGQTQGILFILVIGAATDYSLLYTSRFREELALTQSRWQATRIALRQSWEPIAAAAGTVIAGLLCLLASDLNSNRSLGPVAALGIVFAFLAALTMLPSLLLLTGRVAFWPRHPVTPADASQGLYGRIGELISRRARVIWIAVVVVLLAAAGFATQLRASGVPQSELVLGRSDARDGQALLAQHFEGGDGSPVFIITSQDAMIPVGDTVRDTPGVAAVVVTATDSPTGSANLTTTGVSSTIPGAPAPAPTVSGGDVLVQATLQEPADSAKAAQTVRRLRAELGEKALVGGVTATSVDTADAATHDRNLIIPLILVVVTIILMALLRSVVAALLLLATTVLSFLATMGVSALVFNHVLTFPGADPTVPLYGFVFLVALGVDYNIFLMSRVREEAGRLGTRAGVLAGLASTGAVITSAGIVLAATFAALAILPILFLVQLAFIVAFGVLLDTIVVRTLLVPALAHDLAPALWWPSGHARGMSDDPRRAQQEAPGGPEVSARRAS